MKQALLDLVDLLADVAVTIIHNITLEEANTCTTSAFTQGIPPLTKQQLRSKIKSDDVVTPSKAKDF
ncbi:hypothetical protein [Acidithiobacillus thiooxidans]|uniref:Uncharacterized protein n=1 Tax=Acidithiobacillus thiooxidans TaxID=930 RepID=A0A1C2HZG2_ACITH|nr:hypothetical protein [Acidithiobacillus thiooxidans]OCX69129.1 hypothetical protein A6M23_15960 [Acidithiobacillus thiooxidans]OCX78785.1 hypothetical protein A6P08_18945 [Acidithiobacillus thiooxidans]